MAVGQITEPNQLSFTASEWANHINRTTKQSKGFASVTLSSYNDSATAPDITVGSMFENNGVFYEVTGSDESPTGSVSNNTQYYILYNVSAGEFQFTSTAPTWSDTKQGHYDAGGNNRYLFEVFIDSSGNYDDRRYLEREENRSFPLDTNIKSDLNVENDATVENDLTVSNDLIVDDINSSGTVGGVSVEVDFRNSSGTETKVGLNKKVVEIGDWNMDADTTKVVNHGLSSDFKKVRGVEVIIRDDTDVTYIDINSPTSAGVVHGGSGGMNNTSITLVRTISGAFDNSSYDSTSYNRGWVTFSYVD